MNKYSLDVYLIDKKNHTGSKKNIGYIISPYQTFVANCILGGSKGYPSTKTDNKLKEHDINQIFIFFKK